MWTIPIDAHQHARANRQNHRDHKTPRSVSIFSSIVLHRGRRLLDLMSFFHSYGSQSPDRPPIIDHKKQSTIASLSIRSSKPMSYHHSFATSLHHTNNPQRLLCCDPWRLTNIRRIANPVNLQGAVSDTNHLAL